jgi:hypothetical protein
LSTYQTLKDIFKVIYSPRKALAEIIQNPKYIGPILIMLLFTAANLGSTFILISKTYAEQTSPTSQQKDMWTENGTLWTATPNVTIEENFADFINGSYYGNRSIEFSTINNTQLSMQLNDIGSVNCSGPDGYKTLYARIKRISPEDIPENVTIYLFSTTSSDFFHYNLTDQFSNSTLNVWNNLTIQLGSGWNSIGNANWENITGLRLEFGWPSNSNITLLVDGLFFGGVFGSPVENMTNYMINFSIITVMQFVIRWIFLGGLLFIMTRAFKANTVWRIMLIIAGFALVTMFVQALINVITFSTLPTLYYRFQLLGGVRGESNDAYNEILNSVWLVSAIGDYVMIIVHFWTVALCGVATRLVTQFSWSKSLLVAAVAYFVAITAQQFIIGI